MSRLNTDKLKGSEEENCISCLIEFNLQVPKLYHIYQKQTCIIKLSKVESHNANTHRSNTVVQHICSPRNICYKVVYRR